MKRFETAIVIGASSGIGAEIVRQLASGGCRVAAIARREYRLSALAAEYPERILAFSHDVSNFGEAPELFQRATGELGGLDLIVYAAGIMPSIGPDEFDFETDHRIFAVNLLGAMSWLDLAATRFHATRRGSIVAIGSVAGDRGRIGHPAYCASKAALATYMESLRNRLHRCGVSVSTIKPGPTRTEMTAHLDLPGMMDPRAVARLTLRKAGVSGEHYAKASHRAAFALIRLLPSWMMRRLSL